MPAGVLAQRWAEQMGQDFAIVKVSDASEHQYRFEVAKYVVKASQMATWRPEEIAQFIGAIKGVKFFAPFGCLYKLQRKIRNEIEAERPKPQPCACGCHNFNFDTEESAVLRDCRNR
jgi:hypothetical protein